MISAALAYPSSALGLPLWGPQRSSWQGCGSVETASVLPLPIPVAWETASACSAWPTSHGRLSREVIVGQSLANHAGSEHKEALPVRLLARVEAKHFLVKVA